MKIAQMRSTTFEKFANSHVYIYVKVTRATYQLNLLGIFGIGIYYVFLKKYLFKMIFFYIFVDCFNILISKIIFKNKKNYFNIFLNKKYE